MADPIDFKDWATGLNPVTDGAAGKDIVTSITTGSNRIRVGTTANDLAVGNHNHDSSYVPLSRTVTGANSVTGGGDLTANRLLSLDWTELRQTFPTPADAAHGYLKRPEQYWT